MSIIVEQRPPVIIQLISRVSTYAHYIESILAIIVLWLCPSLTPKMPARRALPKSPRFSRSIESIKSTTSTLVDCMEKQTNGPVNDELPVESLQKYNPLSKLLTPMPMSHSLSLKPFARRMSLPARRFSEHITSAISNPFQTPSPDIELDSFFDSVYPINITVEVDVEVKEVEAPRETVEVIEETQTAVVEASCQSAKRLSRFKKLSKKAKTILSLRQQS